MAFARTWFLLSLVLLALLLGASATVPEQAAPVAQAAAAQAADREGRYLAAQVAAQVQDQRLTAASVGGDPRLAGVFAMGEMPPEAVQSFMDKGLKEVAADHPRFRLVVVGQAGQLLGRTLQGQQLLDQVTGSVPVKAALTGKVSSGRLSGGEWISAAPLRDAQGASRGAVALVAGGPVALLKAAHEEARFETTLMMFEGEAAAGGLGAEKLIDGLQKQGLDPAAEQDPVKATVDGAVYGVRRFTVPGAGKLSFALAWPEPVVPGVADALSSGALFGAIQVSHPVTLIALGVAIVSWLIGFIAAFVAQRKATTQLKKALDEVVETPHSPDVEASRLPGWLRPVGQAAQEALEAVQTTMSKASGPAPEGAEGPSAREQQLADEVAVLKAELEAARKAATNAARSDLEPESSMGMEVALETSANIPAIRMQQEPEKRDIVLPAIEEEAMPGLEEPPLDEAESTADKEVGPELREASIPGAPLPPELLSPRAREEVQARKPSAPRLPGPSRPTNGKAPGLEESPEDEAEQTAHGDSRARTAPSLLLGKKPEPVGVTESTAIGPPPEMPEGRPDEGHFRETYDEFIETRRACGESTTLTYEKFRRKLMATRNQLFERFECEDVRFKVYVKNGKASLKATPVFNKPMVAG